MSDNIWTFEGIAPYEGKAFDEALQRLRAYPQLMDNFTDIISGRNRFINKWKSFHAKKTLSFLLNKVKSSDDFRKIVMCDLFMEMVESSSIEDFSYSGISDGDDRPCIYISNHRDIVLDAALLILALYREDRDLCEMVIGHNLLANQFVTDMFKVNGAITVRRDLNSTTELKHETLRLSAYIRHCIEVKKKSVWIAQKSGRSKDGIDNTSPSILKMLYLAYREEGIGFEDFIRSMPIRPVSISYQYDPCDVTKSQEEIRKLREEGCFNVYKKKKYADIIDMVRGIRHYKGNVNISVGKPIEVCGDVPSAVREIDRQIHLNYKLWDTNYFAYDYLNKTERFKAEYENMNTDAFIKHYKELNPDVADFVYRQYANPVQSMLNEKEM